MSETRKSQREQSWVVAVSERAGVARGDTEKLLEELGIHSSTRLPRPRRMLLKRLQFSGNKMRESSPEPFTFDWELGPGVWCLASEDNFVGKSSVLRVATWALRGYPGELQLDVKKWISSVDLQFAIDEVDYRVAFSCDGEVVKGEVTRNKRGTDRTLATFDSADDFAQTMDEVMSDALGLDRLPAFHKFANSEDGRVVMHSWPAYASALILADPANRALLGDVEMAGLPGRLLQVYVGLPWASTAATARAKALELGQEERYAARRMSEDDQARQGAEAELQVRLAEFRERLSKMADPALAQESLTAAYSELGTAQNAHLQAQRRLAQLDSELVVVREKRIADKARLQDAEESRYVRRFFEALEPSCCPRCETKIDNQRKLREKAQDACALCASPLNTESNDEAALALMRQTLAASEKAEANASTLCADAKAAVDAAGDRLIAAERTYTDLRRAADSSPRRNLELDIAKLEGALEERVRTRTEVTSAPATSNRAARLAVAKAAAIEADQRAKAAAEKLFAELNTEIRVLANAFGIDALADAKLDRAAHLKVTKGGQTSSFSSLTSGERLRLRVATVVAMLRVAAKHEVGRHPGVILLDSAGGEESKRDDAAALVRELLRICDELPELQVIVATARPELVEKVVPKARMRFAPTGKHIW